MRRTLHAMMMVSALFLIAAPSTLASDAVTQCGAAQLKAIGDVYKGYLTEAARACAAGSAGNPQSIDVAKVTAIVTKANAAIQASIDKFAVGNCFTKTPIDVGTVVDLAQSAANQLCLVPSPTPTSTP